MTPLFEPSFDNSAFIEYVHTYFKDPQGHPDFDQAMRFNLEKLPNKIDYPTYELWDTLVYVNAALYEQPQLYGHSMRRLYEKSDQSMKVKNSLRQTLLEQRESLIYFENAGGVDLTILSDPYVVDPLHLMEALKNEDLKKFTNPAFVNVWKNINSTRYVHQFLSSIKDSGYEADAQPSHISFIKQAILKNIGDMYKIKGRALHILETILSTKEQKQDFLISSLCWLNYVAHGRTFKYIEEDTINSSVLNTVLKLNPELLSTYNLFTDLDIKVNPLEFLLMFKEEEHIDHTLPNLELDL